LNLAQHFLVMDIEQGPSHLARSGEGEVTNHHGVDTEWEFKQFEDVEEPGELLFFKKEIWDWALPCHLGCDVESADLCIYATETESSLRTTFAGLCIGLAFLLLLAGIGMR
jgi:hypothetical protein